MRSILIGVMLIVGCSVESLGCSCFEPANAKVAMKDMGAVFRGKVLQREVLAQHPQMRERVRYRLTTQVVEQWRGESKGNITLYDMDPGTDCIGAGLKTSGEYLVYASNSRSADSRIGGTF